MTTMYFAYGSNLLDSEMARTCNGYVYLGIAYLHDYRLDFNRYSTGRQGGVADIVPDRGNIVIGALYRIEQDCLDGLDLKEGVRYKAYQRTEVTVVYDGEVKEGVMSYEVVDKQPYIAPHDDYLDIIISGAKQKNFPNEYILKLESFRS